MTETIFIYFYMIFNTFKDTILNVVIFFLFHILMLLII